MTNDEAILNCIAVNMAIKALVSEEDVTRLLSLAEEVKEDA